ncbi:MAG: phytanoyl-CoA dioxygenase family protein [Planctomycetota bacterium]
MFGSRRPLDLPRKRLPWLDALRYHVEDYVRALPLAQRERFALRARLFQWMLHGYAVLEQAVEPELIDALLADVDEILADPRHHSSLVLSNKHDHVPVRDVDSRDFYGQHMRFVDLHQASIAGKKVSLHPRVIEFVRHLFRTEVVMMQSLTFLEGSEQLIHQDHAYVHSGNPAHLCAAWVALEDIDPRSGPLSYVPGSHAVPMFDWGNGLLRRGGSTASDQDFAAHIERECAAAGLERLTFCPRKGDVFVWHGALAHGGTPVAERGRTRRAHVTHYSQARTFRRHYRDRSKRPVVERIGGGLVYHDPTDPANENRLQRGARF